MSDQHIDIDAVLLRLRELEAKSKELDQIKKDLKEIKDLTSIGTDVAAEVQQEIVANVEALKQHDITIPFLQKQADEIQFRKLYAENKKKPLLESDILEAQKENLSARKTAHKLGVSYPTYKKYCKMYGIHKIMDKKAKRANIAPVNPFKGKYPLDRILKGEFPQFPVHRLKDKMIRAGIKKAECEQCGFGERRITDAKIPLLLNFEDGDKTNHKVENLKLLCYNCTFICGKGYIRRGTVHFNMDPDMLQGAKYPIKARF